MPDPREQLQTALKEALKNKDNQRRDVIRMTLSAVKQVEIDTRKELSEDEVMTILQKEAKKRRETITELTNAGRTESIEQEQFELAILEEFLPRQLNREEIEAFVKAAMAETGVSSTKEMSKLMAAVMPKVKGLADGKLVNQVVKELLDG